MFKKYDAAGFREVVDKIEMQTLVYGKRTLMAEFRLTRGAELPRHSHPHEQIGYLVSGCMELTIGNEALLLKPGDSWVIPGNVEHHAKAIEDTSAVEVFSPVREDYLPQNNRES